MNEEAKPVSDRPGSFEPVAAVARRSLRDIAAEHEATTAKAAADAAPAIAQEARYAAIGEFLIDALTEHPDGETSLAPFVESGTFPDQTARILCDFEIEQRQSRPGFDVTTMPVRALAGIVRRRLESRADEDAVKGKKEKEAAALAAVGEAEARAGEREAADRAYAGWLDRFGGDFLAAVKAADTLPTKGDAKLEAEKAKLLQFGRILDVAHRVSPADRDVIAGRMATLDMSRGVPSPIAFIQTAIFSSPEQPSGVSDAAQAAIAAEFNLNPRSIRTGSDFENAMAATKPGPDGVPVPAFPESEPLRFRPGLEGFTSDDGQREFMRATSAHGDTWPVDVTGWGVNDKTRAAEFLQLWAMTENAGETGFLISLTKLDLSINSQIDLLRLKQAAQIVDATFGGNEGYDGEIFYGDDELGMIRWQAQLRSPRGSAVQGDHDASMTDDALKALGIRDKSGNLDLDVLRAFGEFSRGNWFAAPDYEDVQAYLAKLFPKKFAEVDQAKA